MLAEGFDGVLHFAARSLVGESVQRPELYWQGNVVTTLRLLEAMRRHGTPRLVFSSTAATYGEPEQVPIREDAPTRPTNPYGASKLAIDHAITSYAAAHGLAAVSLRYFNVAGAHGRFGERHAVETHLIPLVLQVAAGHPRVGAGVRRRLADPGRHLRPRLHPRRRPGRRPPAGAASTRSPGRHAIYNLGSRQRVLGARGGRGLPGGDRAPDPGRDARRAASGDPAVLIASSEAAQAELGWRPQRTDLGHDGRRRLARSRRADASPV